MGIVMEYRYTYDDPYKILAQAIVGLYRPSDVLRLLDDDGFLYAEIQKETRLADIGGLFLDCTIEDVLSRKERMEYMHKLDELARYYYEKIDKERLRREIRGVLSEIGVL